LETFNITIGVTLRVRNNGVCEMVAWLILAENPIIKLSISRRSKLLEIR
jgi:hypothetical protein